LFFGSVGIPRRPAYTWSAELKTSLFDSHGQLWLLQVWDNRNEASQVQAYIVIQTRTERKDPKFSSKVVFRPDGKRALPSRLRGAKKHNLYVQSVSGEEGLKVHSSHDEKKRDD